MRIELPAEHHDRPFAHIAEHYAPEIVAAGGVFGSAPYRYSKLSLRGTGLPLVIALAGGYAPTPRRTAELHAHVFREAEALQRP